MQRKPPWRCRSTVPQADGTAPGRGCQRWAGLGESWCWRLNQPVQHRPQEGGLSPQRGRGSAQGGSSQNSPIGQAMGGSGSPRLEQSPAPAKSQRLGMGHCKYPRQSWCPVLDLLAAAAPQPAACILCSSFFTPLKHTYKGKTQYNANSGAQYPIHRTAIHQAVRDKKRKRFSINIETKTNINLQSSTKTMGSKEIDITNSPYSIRLGSHLPQTPIANLDLKDKSSCRRALPLSCPSDASKMLRQFCGELGRRKPSHEAFNCFIAEVPSGKW